MTEVKPWTVVSFSPVSFSWVGVSVIGVVLEIQILPHYSDERKRNQNKISEEKKNTKQLGQISFFDPC